MELYATLVTEYLTDNSAKSMTVSARQGQADWQGEGRAIVTMVNGAESTIEYDAKVAGNNYTISITTSGSVTVQ